MDYYTNDSISKAYENYEGDLTYEQFSFVCKSYWKSMTDNMKSGNMEDINAPLFGKFMILEGMVVKESKRIEEELKNNQITENKYNRIKKLHETYYKRTSASNGKGRGGRSSKRNKFDF